MRFTLLLVAALGICPAAAAQPVDMTALAAQEELRWGVNAYHQGFFGKAVQSFEKSLALRPGQVLTQTWLGQAYFRAGYEETALRIWRQIMAAGKADSLLENTVQYLENRRGMGRELQTAEQYVVHHEFDGTEPDRYNFARPTTVRLRPDGTLFVVAYGSSEIIHFTPNQAVLAVHRGGLAPFDHPFDVLESGGAVYISEFAADRIVKCGPDFQRQAAFGQKGIGEGQLLGPQFLAADSRGYIYVSDWGNRRVSKFDPAGAFILSFGRPAADFPDQLWPAGLAIDREKVYVADKKQNRIVMFDTNGNFLGTSGQGSLRNPEGLLLLSPETLLVADTTRIMKLDLRRNLWEEWSDVGAHARRLIQLSATPNGEVLAADFDANKIFVISEASSLYTGYTLQVERVDSSRYPTVSVDIAVRDRTGRPVPGLSRENFFLTEFQSPVKGATMALAATDPQPANLAVIVEGSPAMDALDRETGIVLKTLMNQLSAADRAFCIFAGETPGIDLPAGGWNNQAVERLVARPGEKNFRLDEAVATAVNELLPWRGKKAIIYLSSGALPAGALKNLDLNQVKDLMENNSVVFYPLILQPAGSGKELEFLARETAGSVTQSFNPQGMVTLLQQVRIQSSATYVLQYTSLADADFGRRYLELGVQLILYKKSGRAESGYYSPLEYKPLSE